MRLLAPLPLPDGRGRVRRRRNLAKAPIMYVLVEGRRRVTDDSNPIHPSESVATRYPGVARWAHIGGSRRGSRGRSLTGAFGARFPQEALLPPFFHSHTFPRVHGRWAFWFVCHCVDCGW